MSNLGHDPLRGFFEGIPAVYLYLFCEAVSQLGVDPNKITADFDMTREQMLTPQRRITMKMGYVAAQRGAVLAGNLGLGMVYANMLKPTMHGTLSMLVMTSATLEQALEFLSRYMALRAPFFNFQIKKRTELVYFSLEPTVAMDPPIFNMMSEAVVLATANIIEAVIGAEGVSVRLSAPKPSYFERFEHEFEFPIAYGKPQSAVVIPRALFEQKTLFSDASAAQIAKEQCEQEYSSLFPQSETLSQQISRHLSHCPTGQSLPSLEEVASRFHMSTRTLRRRLSELDTSFRQLSEAETKARAQTLLLTTTMSVSEVAYELGYPSVSNFSASFKRMSGMTPKAYRVSHEKKKS